MNKFLTLTATAVLALAIGGASAATIQKSVSGKMAQPLAGAAAGKVLFDQSGGEYAGSVISQNFQSDLDQYDSASADDFVVPVGKVWKVVQVNVTGEFVSGSGPVLSQHVTFYKDNGGLPGSVVADFPGLKGQGNGYGSFSIGLPSKVKLSAGKYWISVQIDMDTMSGGEWGWKNQVAIAGSAPAWQNPGNGFVNDCPKWMNEAACWGVTGYIGDKMFTLLAK
jgi:hypothetical protein